jgi:hypothetical protein
MVLSNEKSPDSWLVLPFSSQFNGWQAPDQVVVQRHHYAFRRTVAHLRQAAAAAQPAILTAAQPLFGRVLSNEKSPDSWLVLPFSSQFNGWQAPDQVVVQMPLHASSFCVS